MPRLLASGSTLVRMTRFAGANEIAGDTRIDSGSFAPTTIVIMTASTNIHVRTLIAMSPSHRAPSVAPSLFVQRADRSERERRLARARDVRRMATSHAHAASMHGREAA